VVFLALFNALFGVGDDGLCLRFGVLYVRNRAFGDGFGRSDLARGDFFGASFDGFSKHGFRRGCGNFSNFF
jgi:hypothetical protein